MTLPGHTVSAVLASFCAIASLPLALECADSPFGIGSCLVVPLGTAAGVITIASGQQRHRTWWFAFTCVCGLWFLLAAYVERLILDCAVLLQRLTQQGTIDLSQRIIEPTALLSVVILPGTMAVLMGGLCGWAVVRLSRRIRSENKERFARWSFSTRELLTAIIATCVFLGVFAGRIRDWKNIKEQDSQIFLSRFSASFTDGNVELLARPEIRLIDRTLIPESDYRTFMPPGVSEYRITCPILREGIERWAVWSYTCNAEHDDMIYQFAYGEAATRQQLPAFPFPAKSYVDSTWTMRDGVPR